MKSAIAIAAIAGLASAAAADLTVNINFGATQIEVGQTTTVTMTATFTGVGVPYMSVANFGLTGNDAAAAASNLVLGDWHMAAIAPIAGSVSGSGLSGVKLQQQALFGAVNTTSTGLVIASWTVTGIGEGGLVSYTGVNGSPISFGVNDANNAFGQPVGYDTSVITSGTLLVTPAPSAMALLGLGGLVAGRRRR